MTDDEIAKYYNSAYDINWRETNGDKKASMVGAIRMLIEHVASEAIALVHDSLQNPDECDPIETELERRFMSSGPEFVTDKH